MCVNRTDCGIMIKRGGYMTEDINIKGVDLSVFQRGIDYKALAADGVKFAIIRAGINRSKDTALDEHIKGCLAAGIDIGYYWYSYARSAEDARREAVECVKAVSGYRKPSYPVFFDAEQSDIARALGKSRMTETALAFVNEMEHSGYPSGVYANPAWMENYYNKATIIKNTDIWLAYWTWDPEKQTKYNYAQTIWQWGIIKARSITGEQINADADICYVDYPAITARWYAEDERKTNEEIAVEVVHGLWGNGAERRQRLEDAGYDYAAVQEEVERILAENPPVFRKDLDEVAAEVIRGLWGNGAERKRRLEEAGYDYDEVQRRVDELL